MKLLVLGGIDDAGKSQTMRFSIRHLGQSKQIIYKFENNRNPPKKIFIKKTPVYIYLCSPQELTSRIKQSLKVFKKRIDNKEPNALVIIAFNLENVYKDSIEACLKEIVKRKLKKSTYFVFLDAHTVSPKSNSQARDRIVKLETRGFNILGEIRRKDDNRIQRGRQFAKYIKHVLKL